MAAIALPGVTTEKLTIMGGGLITGMAEAAILRANPTAGTLVTFGGAILGLVGAMTQRGALADLSLGLATASAASMGHVALQQLWPISKQLGTQRSQALAGSRVAQVGQGISRYPAPSYKELEPASPRLV